MLKRNADGKHCLAMRHLNYHVRPWTPPLPCCSDRSIELADRLVRTSSEGQQHAPILAFLLFTAPVLAVAQPVAPLATTPPPPPRPADGANAPHWTVMGASMNPPTDRNGDF